MDKTRTEQMRKLLARREAVLDSMRPPEDPFDLQKEIDDFFFENAELLLEIVVAAENLNPRMYRDVECEHGTPYDKSADQFIRALNKWNGGD